MYYTVVFFMVVFSHVTNGSPLETLTGHVLDAPSGVLPEVPPGIEPEVPSEVPSDVNLEAPIMSLEEDSADYAQFFNNRIVGGSEAAKGSAPHMVALVIGWYWKSFICGASIISECHILTAAHCVPLQWDGTVSNTFHGRVGSNHWDDGTIVTLADAILHPEYDPWDIKNDVAVLVTVLKIPLNTKVTIIALNFNYIQGGQKAFVTGWGTQRLWGVTPRELQILYLSIISHKQCVKGIYEAAAEWGGPAPPVDAVVEICTFHSAGHGMCHGDSGSALVLVKTGCQVGIVSWGIPCARGGPDVYCRISGFQKFIEKILKCTTCGKKQNNVIQ